jgi:hypothetical protein
MIDLFHAANPSCPAPRWARSPKFVPPFKECFNVPKNNEKRTGRRWLAPAASVALVPLVLLASSGVAMADSSECVPNYTTTAADFSGSGTYGEVLQQAGNTWQDWIWEGPTFQCPSEVTSCTYAWGHSNTTSYSVEVGLSIPDVAGVSFVPSYEVTHSTTTSFTYTVYMKPGQYAQPVQIVDRRWRQGDIVGAWVNSYQTCAAWEDTGYIYNWNGGASWDTWEDNVQVNSYGTYNVYS